MNGWLFNRKADRLKKKEEKDRLDRELIQKEQEEMRKKKELEELEAAKQQALKQKQQKEEKKRKIELEQNRITAIISKSTFYFDLFEIENYQNASTDEINKKFKKISLQFHPGKFY